MLFFVFFQSGAPWLPERSHTGDLYAHCQRLTAPGWHGQLKKGTKFFNKFWVDVTGSVIKQFNTGIMKTLQELYPRLTRLFNLTVCQNNNGLITAKERKRILLTPKRFRLLHCPS